MNFLRKIYCRAFQLTFRAALPLLPYRDPIQLHSLEAIPDVLRKKALRRPLLVTDRAIRSLGLTREIEALLERAGTAAAVYDAVEQNPTSDMVEQALSLYRESGCDCMIAFGGGSPMDCAKAVGARLARPEKPLSKMSGILKVMRKLPLLIAVPTTAGTGSETTLAAVIVDPHTRHKYVINDFALIPSYAVLDARVVHTLPAHVAAATGMDALTHAVEAYIGRSTTRHTRADAQEAVRLVFANIRDAAAHTRPEAEEKMLIAAHLAGRAFTRSYVGYIHAVSHSLSGKYNMPHGQTNATLLPIVLEMYGEAAHKKLARLAACAGIGAAGQSDAARAESFIQAIRALNDALGIPRSIEGIQEADIAQLAAYADKEANPLYPVPVLWDKARLEAVYRKAGCQ